MLVLARQEGDGITFPDLNVEVEIVRIQGNRVQVGVHAARDITVLRSELIDEPSNRRNTSKEDSEKGAALQNRLREISTQLAIAKAQWARGDLDGAERTLRSIVPRPGVAERVASQVSEPPKTYQCDSICRSLQVIHPDCPIKDAIRSTEGLAC